jgi:hypothetical protein
MKASSAALSSDVAIPPSITCLTSINYLSNVTASPGKYLENGLKRAPKISRRMAGEADDASC